MHENDEAGAGDEGAAEGPAPGRGAGILGLPRGAPDRPLVEALVVLAALYLTAYLPQDSSAIGAMLARPIFYVLGMASNLPSALLVLYMMATTEGPGAFGVGRFGKSSLWRGAALAAAAFASMTGLGLLFRLAGIQNPIWVGKGTATIALLPLVVAASAATGYSEELFFRAYLPRRLGQAGLGPVPAIAVSTLVFAGAHGAQGIAGFATAGLLGLVFALRFSRGKDFHEIAIGHAAYNAAVFIVGLYS
jgi:membrane protease YdiL (CAAX protease family)